tara:strand:- start:747 stop:950 length:204 start_codon:yes stop_codon:yes gene_type:complete
MRELKHKKRYDKEIEYKGIVAYERARLEVIMKEYLENPNTDKYLNLEQHMILYQDIVCNCSWKVGDE